jgi:predicted TIM-barrel fold metal-dependent hydrolase
VTAAGYEGPVIDACLHHGGMTQHELVEYMPRGWQEYVEGAPRTVPRIRPMPLFSTRPYERIDGERLPGLPAPAGATSGADRAMVESAGPANAQRVVLAFDEVIRTQSLPNLHVAREIASAVNRWTVERWLDGSDARFHGLVLAACQQPELAAAEIREVGRHPRMAGVAIASGGLNAPLGHPVYHPIHAAAAELDLALVVHAGGDDQNNLSHMTAAGLPATYTEYRLLTAQPVMTHVVSLIGQGVFERWPNLRVLLVGCGVAWVPHLVWRFDMAYRALRRDAPWLRHDPSHYFREHVRLTTYPLATSGSPEALVALLRAFGGMDEILCYGSGFPYWDAGDVDDTAARLPRDWWRRVFHDNAASVFRFEEES